MKTNALTGEGIQELTQAIESHEEWIQGSGELQKRRKLRTEVRIREVMHRELVSRSIASRTVNKILTKRVEAVLSGHATPYSVAMELVDQFGKRPVVIAKGLYPLCLYLKLSKFYCRQ